MNRMNGGRNPAADGQAQQAWLPPRAAVYFFLVLSTSVVILAPLITRLGSGRDEPWTTFAILAALAGVAHLLVVVTPKNEGYAIDYVFVVAAVLLLPPELAVLVAVAQFIPDWLKERRSWYIQIFNTCDSMLSILVASAVYRYLPDSAMFSSRLHDVLAAAAAGVVFVIVNHLLLDEVVHLARGHTFRELGVFSPVNYAPDVVLVSVGIAVAFFWRYNPVLVPFALVPLTLIQRSLSVPALEAEVRVDPKTGLYNARYFGAVFAEALDLARRRHRPLALMMVDLDLLREVNNNYGHLAGDGVIRGVAEVFRASLRIEDVPARFGGEEFSVLLPDTPLEEAMEIAERIRREVAERGYVVETVPEPIRATVSIGVSSFPADGVTQTDLVHHADLAVYRAKLQGRNRVVAASTELGLLIEPANAAAVQIPEDGEYISPLPPPEAVKPRKERRRVRAREWLNVLDLPSRLLWLVAVLTIGGVVGGVLGAVFGSNRDLVGMSALVALIAIGQVLAIETDDSSISVTAVGAIAGASLFGARIAFAAAFVAALVDWSARRSPLHQPLFNVGALTISTLGAVGAFDLVTRLPLGTHDIRVIPAALAAAGVYFVLNTGLLSLALALESEQKWWALWRDRFSWMTGHYLVYGAVAAAMVIGYESMHVYALLVFALPLVLIRRTQEAYLNNTQGSARRLRTAAELIKKQNVSLAEANQLLRERSTAAMESLSATVDARDSYTAGHSRRVRKLALAIGRELELSEPELDLLSHAALFHDIGKLAIPDSILLKPARLSLEEWGVMRKHAEEGARIIERLGFLADAVPAIRHHHERWDGSGYPDSLAGEDIPLGARIIHVADALDSMLTTRIYQAQRPVEEALEQLHSGTGKQFCPRCARCAEKILANEVDVDGNLELSDGERLELLA
jgi:diguanylate cyclase (GGDEF)-like protein/putative nucleotidyltransferase with HDIG domain